MEWGVGFAALDAEGWFGVVRVQGEPTQRLQCSAFLVMTHFLLRDYSILPKRELHSSLWLTTWTPKYVEQWPFRPFCFGLSL